MYALHTMHMCKFVSFVYKMPNIDKLVNLIKAVKKYPKLFKNTAESGDYGDDGLKEWCAVAEECKITTAEAENQWNLLLMEYVEYLKSNRDFGLASHMDFLQPYFFAINDSANIDEVELLKAIESKSSGGNATNIRDTKKEDKNLQGIPNMEKNIKIESTNKKPTSDFNDNTETQSNVKQQTESIANLSSLELIFLGYAKQLQNMPVTLQVKTKRKIADIMDEAELQMIKIN